MKRTILLLVTLVYLMPLAFAGPKGNTRDFERKLERADLLYRNGNYTAALKMYLDLYTSDSMNCNLCYKIGVCYLKTEKFSGEALPYFKKAVSSTAKDYEVEDKKEKRAPLLAHKQLADAYHLSYKFDEAILSYMKFRESMKANRMSDKDLLKDVERKISMCVTGKELMACPAEVKIVNLGKNINSAFPEYAPRLSADQSTMIFTSRRPENTGGRTYDGGQYFEDIYIATKKGTEWQKAVNMGWPINTVGNEAAIGISADGQEILIYKDDMGDGNIYSSVLDGDRWTTPKKLNSNINSSHWEPSAFLSADGQTLYFVSDRPGGYGGTDIYKSKKGRDGEWGKAVNLGPTINTEFDEHSPYIHPDGVTLFFSSKGHRTMGGYDIFFSHTLPSDDRQWMQPTNVGYPINTTGDDAFYMVSADKQSAYYSSNRSDAMGEKDLYMVTFPDAKEPPLALVKGLVLDSNNKAFKNVVITVTDNETNEVEGVYHANSKTGKYLFVLTPGKSHNISYEADGRMFYSENKFVPGDNKYNEVLKDVNLSNMGVGSKVILNNIFFDFDDTKLKPYSINELNRVVSYLEKYPNISVEVTGFADSKGTDDYNRRLSLSRAESVVKYLVSKGIDKKRLKAVGNGVSVGDDSQQKPDPSGRKMDRRVELKIVKVQ
jgi:outer membrane protein OmpA-like peptidoglycan-associated protein